MQNITNTPAHHAAKLIKNQTPSFIPKIGIVLGSGLGSFVDQIEKPVIIQYEDLPGFPRMTVHGHTGSMVLGYLNDVPVVCLQGRAHFYEGDTSEAVKTYVRTLKLLGCEYFIATNASGSLNEHMHPGSLMQVTDHINFQPVNPLVGPNDDAFGERFFPMDNAYDATMNAHIKSTADEEGIVLHEGVYISVLGPNYETAAEIRAFKSWGADAVGMSTVPEVLVARHCGMRVAVIATITNFATGLATTSHHHDAVVATANQAAHHLNLLLRKSIKKIHGNR